MKRLNGLAALFLMTAVACGAAMLGGPTVQAQAPPAKITPASMTTHLQNQGHQVQQIRDNNGNVYILAVQMQRNGQQYNVEIEFTPNGQAVHLVCLMGQPGAIYTADQLRAMLDASHRFSPVHVAHHPFHQRMCLEDFVGTQGTPAQLQQVLDNILNVAGQTQNLF
jgi:hypothetical protein